MQNDLSRVVDALPGLVWAARPDGGIDFINRRWCEYTGLSSTEALDSGWQMAIHPEDLPEVLARWKEILASGEPGEMETRMRRFDGEYRWFQSRWGPLFDENGTLVQWYGANTDIDDRKRTEELLSGEKQLLEMVASAAPLQQVLDGLCELVGRIASACHCGILFADPTGTTWLQAAGPALPSGYKIAMVGRPAHRDSGPCGRAASSKAEVIVTDVMSDERWEASGWRSLALGFGLRSCWSSPILARDKTSLGVLALYQHDPGEPTAFQLEIIRQLTHIASIAVERSNIDSAFKRSEACLVEAQRLSLTGSFGWIVSMDAHFWSKETFRIFEYDPSTPVSIRLVLDRAYPADIHLVEEAIELAAEGKGFDYECRFQMPGGSTKILHIVAHATYNHAGEVEYIGAVQDVTDRRSSEEVLGKLRLELTHMARVTSLGALTASIAHEVNQPLSGIMTNASTCLRMLASDPPNVDGAKETARRTIRDGNRASDVITRLRALFSKNSGTKESVDLNEAAREVIALSLTELQRTRVVLRPDFTEGLPAITGDRIQLQQVILNLLMNASDAMSTVDDRPRQLTIGTRRDEGDSVQLTVKDAGIGLDIDDMDRLFDAFYTTKESGMGIGLAVSRSIIESHQGRLWAVANEGPGATFAFSIPLAGRDMIADEIPEERSRLVEHAL